MGYYFECDHCNHLEPLDYYSLDGVRLRHPRMCNDCGQDGCWKCMPDNICDSCSKRKEEA